MLLKVRVIGYIQDVKNVKEANMISEIASDTTLEGIERELLTQPPLKLGDLPRDYYKRRRRLELIIDDIIWKGREHLTLYAHNGKEQCDRYKRRSQGDLFRIVKYYRPEVTFKEFRQALFNLVNSGKVTTSYCNNINKRVFHKHYKGYQPASVYHDTTVDELGLTLVPTKGLKLVKDWYNTPIYVPSRQTSYYARWTITPGVNSITITSNNT